MLFSTPRISFDIVDPLAGGLGDDIAALRRNPESVMDLSDQIDADELSYRWGTLLDEARDDPEWFDFANS